MLNSDLFFLQECVKTYNESFCPMMSFCLWSDSVSFAKQSCSFLNGVCANASMPYVGFCRQADNICYNPYINFIYDDFWLIDSCFKLFRYENNKSYAELNSLSSYYLIVAFGLILTFMAVNLFVNIFPNKIC